MCCRDTDRHYWGCIPRVYRTQRHRHSPNQPTCKRVESASSWITIVDMNWYQIAEKIRPTVDKYQQAFPALLEIPSKDHPYGQYTNLNSRIQTDPQNKIHRKTLYWKECRNCSENRRSFNILLCVIRTELLSTPPTCLHIVCIIN